MSAINFRPESIQLGSVGGEGGEAGEAGEKLAGKGGVLISMRNGTSIIPFTCFSLI